MKNKSLLNTLLLFLAAAVTFIFVPLFMIGASLEDSLILGFDFIEIKLLPYELVTQ